MNKENILELISVYDKVDQKLNKIVNITDHNKTKYTYEIKQECLQLSKEIDSILAKAYTMQDISEKEKMCLEWYHEQTQNMIQVIIKSVSG